MASGQCLLDHETAGPAGGSENDNVHELLGAVRGPKFVRHGVLLT
jgi:hypothetical protein